MQFSTWSFAKLAVVLGFGGLLLGAAGSFLFAPMYVSKAAVRVEPSEMRQIAPIVLSRSSLSGVIQDPRLTLYRDELKTTPFEDVINEMRRNIRIDAFTPDSTYLISFQYPDQAKAKQTVASLIGRFDEESWLLEKRWPVSGGKHFLEVVDTASLPVLPVWPSRGLAETIGCLFGLSIPFLWRTFRKKRLLTWGFAVSGLVYGLAGALAGNVLSIFELVGNQYRSSAMMSIQNGTPEQIQALANGVLSRTSMSAVITDPRMRLYQEQLKTVPLEDVRQTLQKHLSIAATGSDAHYLNISFDYRDRLKAQQAVQMMMNRIDQEYMQMYARLPDEPVTHAAWGKFEVLDQPSTPVLPVSPNRYQIAGEGGIAGLCAAAIIALIRRRWKPEGDIPVDAVNE